METLFTKVRTLSTIGGYVSVGRRRLGARTLVTGRSGAMLIKNRHIAELEAGLVLTNIHPQVK